MRHLTIILSLALFMSATAQTYLGGTIYHNRESGLYCAAVKTDRFVEYAATQQNENWCWAACIEMVLHYQGVNVSQTEIVTSVFGYAADCGGTAQNMVKAINSNGRNYRAHYETPSTKSKLSFVDDLAKKYPLIVGLDMPDQSCGHAYVLTGVVFSTDTYGHDVYPTKVILRNPWPFTSNQHKARREELDWSDFISRVHTIIHVYPY